MYRKRFWIDSAGRWRDRSKGNRLSKGPKGSVDRREYGHFTVNIPAAWKSVARFVKPTGNYPSRKLPPTAVWNSPFRRFVREIKGNRRLHRRIYVLVQRTLARYKTDDNRSGERTYPVLFRESMSRAAALRMTTAQIRDEIKADMVLCIMEGKTKDERSRLGTTPKMTRYFRAIEKPTSKESQQTLRKLKTKKGKIPGSGKRKRYTASR